MSIKSWIYFLLIAFFVGAIGSITLGRFVIPRIANLTGWKTLNRLVTSSPIIINRVNEVQLNEGVNLIDLIKETSNSTVSIYTGVVPNQTFAGLGTIMSSDGLIFTSKSVVKSNSEVLVVLSDGRKFTGTARAGDPKSDLAIISIQASGLKSVNFGNSLNLVAGQRVLTLGIANREQMRKINSGMITNSVLNNKYLDQVFYSERLTDAFASDLFFDANYAGAPVFDLEGRLVAMIINDRNELFIAENLQMALNSYLETGKIVRPKLGLQYWSFSKLQAELRNFTRSGIVVLSVDKGSPAALAGLSQRDLIFEVNGQSLENMSFEQLLNSQSPSGEMKVKLIRQNKEIELTINLTATQ